MASGPGWFFSILCAEGWHPSCLAATESRFGQQQNLHGEDSMCVAVVLKSSHLRREKEGTRHGEAPGQDRGRSVCLLDAWLLSSLPVAAVGPGATRDFSGAGWECPSPDGGPKAFLGGHGVTRRLRAATTYQAKGVRSARGYQEHNSICTEMTWLPPPWVVAPRVAGRGRGQSLGVSVLVLQASRSREHWSHPCPCCASTANRQSPGLLHRVRHIRLSSGRGT